MSSQRPPGSLPARLAAVLPKGHAFTVHHLSTPPTKCDPLCPAPPGERPDKTFCEKHFLALSTDPSRPTPGTDTTSANPPDTNSVVLVFALEIYIYTTAYTTTIFVAKADSTGYLPRLPSSRGSPSPIRAASTALLSFLVETRRRPGVQCVVSLFARSQSQYLFPGSADNGGKHVLDDRGLVRWWCRALAPLVREPPAGALRPWGSVKGYLLVPGLEAAETRAYIRGEDAWVLGHPLELISHRCRAGAEIPPRCLVPSFPDDPKARFRDELDEEAAGSAGLRGKGAWRSVRSLGQFWDMMEFRQECSSGRLTGFMWVVFDDEGAGTSTQPASTGEKTGAAASSHKDLVLSPKAGKKRPAPKTAPGKKRREKKTPLTGRIRSRRPQIKTHARAGLSDRPAASCAYYHWPAEGRGERVLDEKAYRRVMELLLHLDFGTLELAAGSTRRWVGEVGMGSGWGVGVVGEREGVVEEREGGGGVVNNLAGMVKRKRKRKGEGEGEVKVNVLGGGLVRKKPKAEGSG